ncbi:butyrate-acetoacetate CoA-transferase small chain [Oceanobacillus iheyensis HTE831]|uniref:Butyrate-acetoacetate CoA-transferase small chain n=1 Tax=Oceanobacillus iheyensis (strain DSM 14371 / CIP 107618 / JCM 11309 / KCTC 3954 / HTE831) TaxID=221109 RepID=Q8EN54_OCEIH|nr:acetate CoA-transferase subunit alpha [Oceanobacillus iheyensis]BAC14590.1 butyrate-acetoacetate CoA-transferase small chain [Oceanobacillus iheyensis HTE831]
MVNKLITFNESKSLFQDKMTIMSGGFMGVGTPEKIVEAILESEANELTLITNDTSFENNGVGPLIANNRIAKVVTSHIGTNRATGRKMISKELEVELVPQGTLAERIRAGGAGLGGFLTPTGVGTVVEKDKQVMQIEGKKYILETPLKADIAIIKAYKADKSGNLVYRQSARNFNPLIALAAKLVIVQAEHIVEIGELDPECIVTPNVLVDKILI